MMKLQRCAIYIRVSTTEQMMHGKSLESQKEYLINYAKEHNMAVVGVYADEGKTARKELKKRKANKIYCYATYPIFTNGLESFNKAYADGIIDGVFGTNLTYRTPELLSSPWFYEVDCSKYIAYFIASLNHDKSISQVIDPHTKIEALLKKYGIK